MLQSFSLHNYSKMPGRSRGESKYNDPAVLDDFKERLEKTTVIGINPLQPRFILAVIEAGGWNEISPLSQERLDEYLTTEKSQVKMGKEQGVKDVAILLSNRRAIETLHAFFVSACPQRAEEFPLDEVRKGKDPSLMGRVYGGRQREPNSRRSKAERRRQERLGLEVS